MNNSVTRIHQLILNPLDEDFFDINHLEGYSPVIKLGIQAPMGTKFILNMPSTTNVDNYKINHEIEIGSYGIYELDLSDIGHITSLIFPTPSESVGINEQDPSQVSNVKVLVDIVYLDFNQKEGAQ